MENQKEKLWIELQGYSGTEHWHFLPYLKKYTYTDGVRYLAQKAEAYWLIEKIFFSQSDSTTLRKEAFQVWDLKVSADKTARLTCHDGENNRLHREKLTFTDFPLKEITLYFTNNVLLLPSEY